MAALLALHIETALNPDETDLSRSVARISISQTMLVLGQGKEIPVLKRALPVFEGILAKNLLYSLPSKAASRVSMQPQLQSSRAADAYASPASQANGVLSQPEQSESNLPYYGDYAGLDFLGDWELGDWDLSLNVGVDMNVETGTE